MFAKATRNFLKEVDSGGNLIAVSTLNDSDKLQLLSLVTKKKRYWRWQRPKYQFLSVTLGDVLTEDQSLSPGRFLWVYATVSSGKDDASSFRLHTVLSDYKIRPYNELSPFFVYHLKDVPFL